MDANAERGGDAQAPLEQRREAARVLVVDDNPSRARQVASALDGEREIAVLLCASESPALARELLVADLALLALGGRRPIGLDDGALARRANPFTEIVLYGDDADVPEAAAASVLGITRIVPARDMAAWLARAGGPLARGARLRRLAAAAIEAVPPPPRLTAPTQLATGQPLPSAERQFRERYIRYLLGLCASRQEAARRAGVPYRILCDMIRELGIASD